jgi:hypothetical protein
MAGSKLPDIVSAVSGATCQYVISSAIVNSTNIVTGPGVGTQTGRVVGLIPQQMSTLMQLKAASSLITGKDFGKLCDAISFGVVNAMNSVLLQGTVIGGGPGSGTGKIMGLIPTALTTLILAQEAFRLISGNRLRDIVSAFAFGICTHIMTVGTVTITNIGVASPPPAGTFVLPVAPGIGRLV